MDVDVDSVQSFFDDLYIFWQKLREKDPDNARRLRLDMLEEMSEWES